MAGGALGRIYVELDLDKDRYMKNQRILLEEAQNGAKILEKNYKNLGMKSDAMYDLQRAQAEKSYSAIAKSGKASASELVRAEKAKTDRIKQLNNEQFGHQRTSMDQIKAHWKGATLAMAAATAAMAAASIYAFTKVMSESVKLANIQEASEARLAAVINATGQAAGYNIEQMKGMAAALQKVTTVGDEVILNGMAILATFKNIRGEAFERTTKAALDMSAVMQQDVKSSMVMISKAMNDPIANLSAMTRAGVQFTKTQKDMIKQLWETGDMMGAQNIILKELESQFGGTAAAMRDTFGGATTAAGNAIGDLKEEIGFLITKNEAYIELMKQVEEWAVKLTSAIKYNKQAFIDFATQGLTAFVKGMETAILAMGFLIEGMQNVSRTWLGVKQAMLSAEIYAVKVKLWANEGEVSEKKIRMELEATQQAYQDVKNAMVALDQKHIDTNDAIFKIAAAFRELQATIESTKTVVNSFQSDWDAMNEEMTATNPVVKDVTKAIKDNAKELAQAAKDAEHLEKAFDNISIAVKKANEAMEAARWDAAVTSMSQFHDVAIETALALQDMDLSDAADAAKETQDIMGELNELLADNGELFEGSIFGDDASENINNLMKSLSDLTEVYDDLAKNEARLAKLRENIAKENDPVKHAEMVEKAAKLEQKYMVDSIIATGQAFTQVFGSIKNMYAENSEEYKKWAAVEKITAIATILLTAAQAIINAGASGDGYTAIARMAAMAAAVGAVLGQVGLSVSGPGGSSGSEPADYTAGSTLYGAEEGAASESLSNGFEMLEDLNLDQYGALLDIYLELQRLNANITGLVTAIVKTGTDSGLSMPGDIEGSEGGTFANVLNGVSTFGALLAFGPVAGLIQKVLGGFLSGILESIGSFLFGGDTSYEVIESGLQQFIGSMASAAPLMGGIIDNLEEVSMRAYLVYNENVSGGVFKGDDQNQLKKYGEPLDTVTKFVTDIVKGIGQTMLDLVPILGFGEETIKKIMSYAVNLGTIDLKNLNPEQIGEALNAWFSNFADEMAGDIFGALLIKYQKVDEGLYETAIRLAVEKEMILEVLDMTGQAFAGTALEAVHFSQALIDVAGSLEALAESAETYFDEYLTDAEKLIWLTDNLADSYKSIGATLPETRDAFKDLISSLDLTKESDMELYVALLAIAGATDAYYDALETATEKIIAAKRELTGSEDAGAISDIESRYGLSAGIVTESFAIKYINQFLNASEDEIIDFAEAMNISVEQLTDDLLFLSEYFELAGDAAIATSYDFKTLTDSIRANLKSIQDEIDLKMGTTSAGSASGYYRNQMIAAQAKMNSNLAAGDLEASMADLLAISQLSGDWYHAALAEAQEAANIAAQAERDSLNAQKDVLNDQLQVAKAFGSLVDRIESAVLSLKYSNLNVNTPQTKAISSQSDYDILKALAMGGDIGAAEKFTAFTQTYLTQQLSEYGASTTYDAKYESVMADLEALRASAVAMSYEEAILAQLAAIETALDAVTSAIDPAKLATINQTFADISAWIEAMIAQIETTTMLLEIDWGIEDPTGAKVFSDMKWLLETYGSENPIVLDFIAGWATACKDIDDAAAVYNFLVGETGIGSKAALAFIAAWAPGQNITDAASAYNYLVKTTGVGSTSTLTFVAAWASACTSITDASTALEYLIGTTGANSTTTLKFVAALYDSPIGGVPITDIDAWLLSLGVTDTTVRRNLEVKLIYDFVADGTFDVSQLADWAFAKMVAASALDKSTTTHNLLQSVLDMAAMFGKSGTYAAIGEWVGGNSALAASAGWTSASAQQAAINVFTNKYAEGGLVTSPTYGLVGEAGYPEAIIPMKDGMNIPVKFTGGSGQGSGRPIEINLTLEIDGKPLDAKIKVISRNESENVRVNLVRWGKQNSPARQPV